MGARCAAWASADASCSRDHRKSGGRNEFRRRPGRCGCSPARPPRRFFKHSGETLASAPGRQPDQKWRWKATPPLSRWSPALGAISLIFPTFLSGTFCTHKTERPGSPRWRSGPATCADSISLVAGHNIDLVRVSPAEKRGAAC